MKVKLALVTLFGLLVFASCKKAPCPAYGKIHNAAEKTIVNS